MDNKEKNLNSEVEETTGEVLEETEAATEENVTEEASQEDTVAEAEAARESEADPEEGEAEDEAEAETADDGQDSDEEVVITKKPAEKEVLVIKRKSTLNTASVITMIVCAVIVVACVIFTGVQLGWFEALKPKAKNKMTLGDYSVIEVSESSVNITDDQVQERIDEILSSQETEETVTEGTVAEGDSITITYTGYYNTDGAKGETFEGGSAEDQTITVGSSGFIDGFDDGLVGAEIGSTVDLYLTFPEDYSNDETLAGVDVIFEVTISSKTETITPELTDEFAQEYSEGYFDTVCETTEAFEDYIFDYLYTYYLHQGMLQYLQGIQTVTSYDEEVEAMLIEYSAQTLEYYASNYGYDADSFAALYGYEDALSYETAEAHNYMDMAMLFDYLMDELDLSYTDEEVDADLESYMKLNGYSDEYTLEEFKETSGETWVWLYTNIEFKYDLVLDELEDRVVFVADEEESSTAATE